ncbi:PilZ domain-containing protein [Sphingomonas xinjiangensis]|uniref:PilZ domain-containing protein n=1 Tax=Sphingomonas xinjiangensis TaxID=643568 RepID=A0A840YTA5_9SPHN|nr:PilZ domain-containing protein [Sphingomonas xinjiangensis]MBB5712914.1 hypothetical protein [Sphingomonas xinjiangensis]
MYEAFGMLDERKTRRSDTHVAATVVHEFKDTTHVYLLDVGLHGCRVSTPTRLTAGSFVTVIVKGLPSLEAWVAWSNDSEAGLNFAHKPPPNVVAAILAA